MSGPPPPKSSHTSQHHPTLGLHAEARPFVPYNQTPPGSPAFSPTEVIGSPIDHSPIPHGLDREAFVAGERAAMARTLHMLLPSQQAIGMLSSGLQRLEARVQEEAAHSRQSHLATADCRSVVQGVNQRLDYLEKIRLPGMDNRIQHAIEAPLSQEFRATLLGLKETLGTISERNMHSPYSITGFAVRQLGWLGSTAALYAQKAISKADVAAIFLSRKILIDSRVSGLIGGGSSQEEQAATSKTSQSARAVIGAVLFLAAVEAAWQTHSRVVDALPRRVRKATKPAELGLQVLRGATWAATLTLSAVYFRRGCYVAADSALSGVDRVVKQVAAFKPFSGTRSKTLESILLPGQGCKYMGGSDNIEPSQHHGDESAEAKSEPHDSMTHEPLPPGVVQQRQRSIFDTPPPSPPV